MIDLTPIWIRQPYTDHPDPVLVRRTKDPYGWLGNMSPFPVKYQRVEYRTTEALFQCMRLPWDSPVRELIRQEKSPMGAKIKAMEHNDQRVIECLGEQDLDNMRICLRLKVEQHPQLRPWLLQTGDRPIVEDCTRRQRGTGLFWGAALLDDGTWYGMNWLGRLWEEIRSELQAQEDLFDEITRLS